MSDCATGFRLATAVCLAHFLQAATLAQGDPIRLQEQPRPGDQYQVQTRVQLSGSLAAPAKEASRERQRPEDKQATLSLTGESAIDYDERVLNVDDTGRVTRTVRVFRRVDLDRQLGSVPQKSTIRPAVRRQVFLRADNTEVAFSPDGPLTWAELDLVRTDVFTPALLGLLPDRAVAPGDRWKATTSAVRELTDLEQVEEGGVDCRFDRVETVRGRRVARVSFSGTVRGTNEDGPNKQELGGTLDFDVEGGHLSSLTLNGRHWLLNGEGKEAGRVDGRFVLSRQPLPRGAAELSDAGLRGVALEPGADNTRMLYENSDLGVSLVHPRRWRVGVVQGRQITLDGRDGSGILITLDPPDRAPSGAQFLAESRDWLTKQKGKIVRLVPPRTVQASPAQVEHFQIDVEMNDQSLVMDYHVARQRNGGATLAARLPAKDRASLQREVEGVARSLRITRPLR